MKDPTAYEGFCRLWKDLCKEESQAHPLQAVEGLVQRGEPGAPSAGCGRTCAKRGARHTLLGGDSMDRGPWRPPSASGGVGGAGGMLVDRPLTGSSGRRSSAATGSAALHSTTPGLAVFMPSG